jgi:hypothetical protein
MSFTRSPFRRPPLKIEAYFKGQMNHSVTVLVSNSAARVEHQHVAKSLPDSRKQNIAKSRPDSQAQNIARFHESLLDLQPVAGTEYRTVAWHRIGTEYRTGVSQ